jgi:hypothetical protein
MPKKTSDPSSLPNDDNPEWTPEIATRARPAAEVLPQYIGQPATDALLRRPPKKTAKSTKPYALMRTFWTHIETKAKAGKRSSMKYFCETCRRAGLAKLKV